jgi:hypothetical protein
MGTMVKAFGGLGIAVCPWSFICQERSADYSRGSSSRSWARCKHVPA